MFWFFFEMHLSSKTPAKLQVCQLSATGEHSEVHLWPLEKTVWIPSKFHEQTHNVLKEAHMLRQKSLT